MYTRDKQAWQPSKQEKWHERGVVRNSKVTVMFRNWHIKPIMFIGIAVCLCSQHTLSLKFYFLIFHDVTKGLWRDFFT